MGTDNLPAVIESLKDLSTDSTVPRNVKVRIESTIKLLQDKTQPSLRVNKALQELEEIANDTNLQTHARTQVWYVVSLLEKII